MVKTFNPKLILQNSFQKTHLDAPIRLKRKWVPGKIAFERLPAPLVPSSYIAPKPKAKPRRQKPVALPRIKKREVRLVDPPVQKFIREIKPLYTTKAITEFRERFTNPAKVAQREAFQKELASKLRKRIVMKIKERKKRLKGVVQSFEIENISTKDPQILFATSQNTFTKKSTEILQQKGPFKAYLTLRVESKKEFFKMERRLMNSLNPILTLQQLLF